MVYVFSQASAGAAWLMQQKDRYNNSITITRSPLNQRVDSIADQYGRTLKFELHHHGQPGWLGAHHVHHRPNGTDGRLPVRCPPPLEHDPAPDGGVTIYTYEVNNRLTTITDARGITYLTTLYYPSGLVAKQILADGGTYRFEYTLAGSTITQAKVTENPAATRPIPSTTISS
ncbi:MAG: hypothetical protein U0231_04575 [Nitrospiraceae bacterium]